MSAIPLNLQRQLTAKMGISFQPTGCGKRRTKNARSRKPRRQHQRVAAALVKGQRKTRRREPAPLLLLGCIRRAAQNMP